MKPNATRLIAAWGLALVLGLSTTISAQNVTDDFELFDPLWKVMPADVEFLYDFNDDGDPAYNNQGGTVNRLTGNILIPTIIEGDPQIAVVSPEDGSFIKYLNMTEDVSGGDQRLHVIEVATSRDGQIFAVNQVLEANLRLYYWADEDADPVVVFDELVEMPGGGDFNQWGQGLGVVGTGDDLKVMVSGFQNPNVLVLDWNEGQLETENKFQTDNFGYGNGFGEIPGSDFIWTNGAGIEASLFNYTTGEVGASVDAAVLPVNNYDIDYIETDMGSFIIAGPDYPEEPFSVVDVTDPEVPILTHIIVVFVEDAVENVQLTGFVHFSKDANAVVMSSNNPLMFFDLSIGSVSTSGEQVAIDVPENLRLDQNYPNPFNPSTLIVYALQEAAEVSIDVFSANGQRVATINEGMRQAGTHQVSFDASGLASGTYVYQLRAGDVTMTRTMTLVK
ncbi:MAG: T9SS type A sorting domain-containing protein [Cyclonatronaceae bacterium]